jgi:cytochrome c
VSKVVVKKSKLVAYLGVAAALSIGLTAAKVSAQDAENGQDLFRQCRACHQIGAGAKNLVGPQLNGIVGRKASTVEGFNYSDASKDAAAKGLVWTEDKLEAYLEAPAKFMPGTKMAYAGLKEASDRKDVIAYLKKAGAAK